MSRNLGTIKINLTSESILNAVQKLEQLGADLQEALNNTVQEVAKRGEVAAKINLYSGPQADDEPNYGEIAESIHYKPGEDKNRAFVYSDSEDAAYLEYGTGIVGSIISHPGLESGESIPPILMYKTRNGDTHLYTAYDTYKHGLEGWTYVKDGKKIRTVGIPSLAFMYHALRDMEAMAPEEMDHQLSLINLRRWSGG